MFYGVKYLTLCVKMSSMALMTYHTSTIFFSYSSAVLAIRMSLWFSAVIGILLVIGTLLSYYNYNYPICDDGGKELNTKISLSNQCSVSIHDVNRPKCISSTEIIGRIVANKYSFWMKIQLNIYSFGIECSKYSHL